jgi:hypothetical protein
MLSRTLVTLIAVVCLIAAATALVPVRHMPTTAVSKHDIAYGAHKPRYIKGRLMEGCFEEPAECGLVVW